MARTYNCYSKLTTALIRAKVEKPGSVATLLLDCFEGGQKMNADLFFERGICKRGQFTELRERLQKKGFLIFNLVKTEAQTRSFYTPGPKLARYINEKIIETEVIATREWVDSRVVQLEERVGLLEKCLLKDIEERDPPATKEKLEKKLKLI